MAPTFRTYSAVAAVLDYELEQDHGIARRRSARPTRMLADLRWGTPEGRRNGQSSEVDDQVHWSLAAIAGELR